MIHDVVCEDVSYKMGVSDLNLYYGDFHALKNVSLQFSEKQVAALIGPSGCGKSTLLKTLNRMNDLVAGCCVDGTVFLDECNAYTEIGVNDLRRRVGMVFQQPNPFPMSIYDNVAFEPRTHGVKNRDELDLISTAIIEEFVTTLKQDYTIIMVTHNMLQALRVSDQTAFFLLGEMVEAGYTEDIFSHPEDTRTTDYVAGRFG